MEQLHLPAAKSPGGKLPSQFSALSFQRVVISLEILLALFIPASKAEPLVATVDFSEKMSRRPKGFKVVCFVFRVLLILATYLAVPVIAYAQTSETNARAVPKWQVSCNNSINQNVLACAMSQTVVQSRTGQRIVTASIFQNAQGAYFMRLLLPHGLDLTNGVNLSIDGANVSQYPFYSANANGAFARVPLNEGLINAMKAGNVMSLGVKNMGGNGLSLEVSLSGFTTNFALLSR